VGYEPVADIGIILKKDNWDLATNPAYGLNLLSYYQFLASVERSVTQHPTPNGMDYCSQANCRRDS
jgi:hypothetical protein